MNATKRCEGGAHNKPYRSAISVSNSDLAPTRLTVRIPGRSERASPALTRQRLPGAAGPRPAGHRCASSASRGGAAPTPLKLRRWAQRATSEPPGLSACRRRIGSRYPARSSRGAAFKASARVSVRRSLSCPFVSGCSDAFPGEDRPESVSRSGSDGTAEAASAPAPFGTVRPRREAAGFSPRSVRGLCGAPAASPGFSSSPLGCRPLSEGPPRGSPDPSVAVERS